MLAKRIPSILPPLTQKEVIETTGYSVIGKNKGIISAPPFKPSSHYFRCGLSWWWDIDAR